MLATTPFGSSYSSIEVLEVLISPIKKVMDEESTLYIILIAPYDLEEISALSQAPYNLETALAASAQCASCYLLTLVTHLDSLCKMTQAFECTYLVARQQNCKFFQNMTLSFPKIHSFDISKSSCAPLRSAS